MPTPVAALLNSPVMTLSLGLRSLSGSRLLLNSISAPDPFAHQWFGLMPLPMKSAANRRGGTEAALEEESLLQTGNDSSQGRAMVTPRPWSAARRVIGALIAFMV